MNNIKVLKRLLKYIKKYAAYVIFAVISAFISVSMALYAPVLIGNAIDHIIGPSNVDFNGILPILIKLICVVIASAFFTWLMSVCTNKITYNAIRDIRNDLYDKIGTLPLSYIDKTPHGEIISRVTVDAEQISDGMLQGFNQFLTGIITIIGTIFFMFRINVKIAIVVIILTPLSLFVAAFITKISHDKFAEQSRVRGELSGLIEESISGAKVVRAFSYEGRSQEKFEEINERLYKCGVLSQFYSALANPTTRFVNGLVYMSVGIFGSLSIISGTSAMTIGQVAAFLSYANQYTKPFNEITGVITELQSAFASARRIFDVIDSEPEVSDTDNMTILDSDGSMQISDMMFSYTPEIPLIKSLNLAVEKGQMIAIVGPTGCGKTTLINLLMRFYDVNSGSICIDKDLLDIRDIKRNDLRSLYGMVLQDSWIFTGTVKENIAYGRQNASDEEIINAAKTSYAHSFIKRLPQGYDTILSKDGDNLSDGQKQLLSIARIMLVNPPMLILDEATSNIDTRTEQNVQKAFAKLMQGKTCFVIAHRLSTVIDSDVILVMRDGDIIEQGSHEELLNKQGFYHKLFNAQFEIV